MTDRTGGDAFCEYLEALGVDTAFGVPGTQTVGLFEALRKSDINTVLTASELGAAFMANGYFRATGRPGLVITIPGPGFTQALTGIAEARHDSASVLLVVTVPTRVPGRRFQLQEIDHQAMAAPLVKGSFRANTAADLPTVISEAWTAALLDGPGPVLIELSEGAVSETAPPADLDALGGLQPRKPSAGLVEEAWARLVAARKILVFPGQGAADAPEETKALVEGLQACVVSTSSGRGIIPESHPRSVCGDFSVSGTVGILNELVTASDLVLALGCRFTHNGTAGFRLSIPQEKLVHIDSDEESLSGNQRASLSIRSDIEAFLEALREPGGGLPEKDGGWPISELQSWRERFLESTRWRREEAFPKLARSGGVGSREILEALREHLPDDAILVTDSGLHQMAARRWFEVRAPRGLIAPADFQSMGFGVPATIGASLAVRGRKVIAVVGDGGMAMSGLELATAVREELDLTVLVFNDGHLGLIRLSQLQDYGRTHRTRLHGLDFESLARAVGASYLALDGSNFHALPEGLRNKGVTIVDLRLEDSRGLSRARATGLVRAVGRDVFPRAGWRFLKKILGRG